MTDPEARIRQDLERQEDVQEAALQLQPQETDSIPATAIATEGEMPLRQATLWGDAWRELRKNPLFLIASLFIVIFAVMALRPQTFTSVDPRQCDLANSVEPPSSEHLFGYDIQGCDYFTRVIYGARVSIFIGFIVAGSSAVIATMVGTAAGFYGGFLDTIVARLADIVFAIPTILGGIVLLSALGDRGLLQVSLVLILLGWPTIMRLMRSTALSVKNMDYVQAARALGAGDIRIMRVHILPNAIAPVLVYSTIFVGIVISAEAALSFLGVGLQLPAISWGLQISDAETRILLSPHLLFFPGLFLILVVLSFILMGDALRDALDPKLRR